MCDSVEVLHYGRVAIAGDPSADRWRLLERVQRRTRELDALRAGLIEQHHGPGTRMKVAYGHPEWDAADDLFRKGSRLCGSILGRIVAERTLLSADEVRQLAPVPWVLRGGGYCWHRRDPGPGERYWSSVLDGCIVDEVEGHGAGGSVRQVPKGKGKRAPLDVALDRLQAADGGWVEERKLGPGELGVSLRCALVADGWWVEAGRSWRGSDHRYTFHDHRVRLLGRLVEPLQRCPVLVPEGGPRVEVKGRGRWAVEQLALV